MNDVLKDDAKLVPWHTASHKSKRPKEYDLVLGGNNSPPVDGLVLGGKTGILRRLRSGDIYDWNDCRKENSDRKIDLSGGELQSC